MEARAEIVNSEMYYVYVLKSEKNNKYYVGYTNNLKRRLLEHNTNTYGKKYTSRKGPWQLVFYETFTDKKEAIKQENFLKTGKGREYIRNKCREVAPCLP